MMEHKLTIRVTILSYLFLALGAKEGTKQGENIASKLPHGGVNKTIQTADGDVFICKDINQQPAFGHLLLKDHVIQMKPSSFPSGLHVEFPLMVSDSNEPLPIVECPIGTIPILQNNEGGTMSLLSSIIKDTDGPAEVAGIKSSSSDIYGIRAEINVYQPEVKGKNGERSVSLTMIGNEDEGIGAGSYVYPRLNGDNLARFHIYWENNQHQGGCYDLVCPGFVQVSRSVGLGGKLQPISVYDGPQYSIHIQVSKDPMTGHWWLAYGPGNITVGYWPTELFINMKEKATIQYTGGLVRRSAVGMPQMGSGHFASEGFGKAAFVRNIQIVNENHQLVTPDIRKSFATNTRQDCYSIDQYGYNAGGMHAYYGGPGCY
ncbi:hypothetical protein ACP70R_037272 [Stipagrostis hirtigluma subsp. patula]